MNRLFFVPLFFWIFFIPLIFTFCHIVSFCVYVHVRVYVFYFVVCCEFVIFLLLSKMSLLDDVLISETKRPALMFSLFSSLVLSFFFYLFLFSFTRSQLLSMYIDDSVSAKYEYNIIITRSIYTKSSTYLSNTLPFKYALARHNTKMPSALLNKTLVEHNFTTLMPPNSKCRHRHDNCTSH